MEILTRVLETFFMFIIEFAKLFPILFWVLKLNIKSKKQIFFYSIFAIVLIVATALLNVSQIIPFHVYICVLLGMALFKGKYHILYTAVVYIGICIFDMLSATIWSMLTGAAYEELVENRGFNITINAISIAVVVLLAIISSKISINRSNYIFSKSNRLFLSIILLGELSLLDFITVFQINEDVSDKSAKTMAVSLSIGSIAFLLLGVIMLVNYMSRNYYKNIYEVNEKLMHSQEKYFSMLLQKDEETKRFRHDMRNHINCMYILLKENNYFELDNYFKKIGITLAELKIKAQTGHNMVNAILNDVYVKFPEVNFEIEGYLPDKINLSNTDICTLFYNLFENAFTAAKQSNEKKVKIIIKILGSNLYISIINTIPYRVDIVDNKLKTNKKDVTAHGYGTVNARICAEENGGSMIYKCSDNYFEAELILPSVEIVNKT